MKVKFNGHKIIASVVVAAMSIAFIPKITGSGNVLAATTKSADNTRLCTTGIASPVAPANADSAWQGSYVYFGTYDDGTTVDPIKFRVLSPSTDVYGGSTMFLDCDSTITGGYYFDYTSPYSSKWSGSDIQGELNGSFFNKAFTETEQDAIAISKKDGEQPYATGTFENYRYGATVGVNDRVFLLDADEVMNSVYGYSSDSGWVDEDNDGNWTTGTMDRHPVANRKKDGVYSYWWLRSANTKSGVEAGLVDTDGAMYYISCDHNNVGVSPAINVDRNSIIFSTCVDGTYGEVGASYKLTIYDDSLSITAGEASVTGTIVSIGNTVSGGPNQISVLILDNEYSDGNTKKANILYYGALSDEQSFDFSATGLKLADWGKEYYVYILAETVNDGYKTDYATKPVAVAAPGSSVGSTYSVQVDIYSMDKDSNLTPSVGGTATVSKDSGTTGDKITVTATPDEGYELYSIAYGDGGISIDITNSKEFEIETYDVIVDVVFKAIDTSSSGGSTTTDPATSTSSGTTTDPATSTSSGTTTDPATGTTTDTATGTTSGTSGSSSGATMDPSAPTYKVIQGGDGTADGTKDYVLEIERSEDDVHCLDYYDWVAVDGIKLTDEQAPASSGSTIITIKAEYLKTLSEGKHTIVVNFVDNSVSTTLTIQSAAQKSGTAVPATGELQSPALYIGMALIAIACGVTGVVLVKKRKEV